MKTLFAALALAFSSLTLAADAISLRFDAVPVAQLAKAVFGDLLKKSYVLDDEVGKKTVSVQIAAQSVGVVAATIAGILEGAGVTVIENYGVYFLTARRADELIVYKLRHRDSTGLPEVLRQAFPAAQFNVREVGEGQQVQKAGEGQPAQPASRKAEASDVLVFRVPAGEGAAARNLLAVLDTPVDDYYIRAVVYDVTDDKAEGSALELTAAILGGKFGLSITAGKLSGANTLAFKSASVDAVAKLLDTDTRFKSISRPAVRVRAGAVARFSVGQEVPTLGGVTTNVGGSTQAVVYRQAGTIFEVEPVARAAGVEVAVRQTISSFQTTDSSTLNSPTLNKRELSTTLQTGAGEVVVIAGLEAQDESGADRRFFGVPVGSTKASARRQTLLLLEVQRAAAG